MFQRRSDHKYTCKNDLKICRMIIVNENLTTILANFSEADAFISLVLTSLLESSLISEKDIN